MVSVFCDETSRPPAAFPASAVEVLTSDQTASCVPEAIVNAAIGVGSSKVGLGGKARCGRLSDRTHDEVRRIKVLPYVVGSHLLLGWGTHGT
jgi:hypothetical protein